MSEFKIKQNIEQTNLEAWLIKQMTGRCFL